MAAARPPILHAALARVGPWGLAVRRMHRRTQSVHLAPKARRCLRGRR